MVARRNTARIELADRSLTTMGYPRNVWPSGTLRLIDSWNSSLPNAAPVSLSISYAHSRGQQWRRRSIARALCAAFTATASSTAALATAAAGGKAGALERRHKGRREAAPLKLHEPRSVVLHVGDVAVDERELHVAPRARLMRDQVYVERVAEAQAVRLERAVGDVVVDAGHARVDELAGVPRLAPAPRVAEERPVAAPRWRRRRRGRRGGPVGVVVASGGARGASRASGGCRARAPGSVCRIR